MFWINTKLSSIFHSLAILDTIIGCHLVLPLLHNYNILVIFPSLKLSFVLVDFTIDIFWSFCPNTTLWHHWEQVPLPIHNIVVIFPMLISKMLQPEDFTNLFFWWSSFSFSSWWSFSSSFYVVSLSFRTLLSVLSNKVSSI